MHNSPQSKFTLFLVIWQDLITSAPLLRASSRNLLEESVSIAENIGEEARGYLARANFKLAQIYDALNEVERARVCQEAAESIRRRISGDAVTDASQEAYDKLVPWMLW